MTQKRKFYILAVLALFTFSILRSNLPFQNNFNEETLEETIDLSDLLDGEQINIETISDFEELDLIYNFKSNIISSCFLDNTYLAPIIKNIYSPPELS